MKLKCKRLVVLLMTILMVSNSLQITASAEEGNLEKENQAYLSSTDESEEKADEVIYQTMTYVNPIYADVVHSSELLTADENGVSALAEEDYCTTLEEAGAVMRRQMVDRNETITVYYQTTDDNYSQYMKKISDEAMSHTGVPTEGDYLKFQYAGWNCSLSGNVNNGTYYLTMTYTVTYYTTADQEEIMDNTVSELLGQLDLNGKPEYKKIKGVYDYICENVTYDYDKLEDDSYKLKFTAYAALVDKTAVCQGYAVLFYRLMEELDVDCRVISGIGNGGAHAWNIAGINGSYYNLDSTWDAGKASYSYFLKCDANFGDHIRNENYADDAFTKAYPMGTEDYIYTEAEIVASGICGDNLTWTLDSDGLLTISGTGKMSDYSSSGETPWYYNRDDIISVIIENGITSIGNSAFDCCGSLTSIKISDSVTSIGSYAFYNCISLPSVDIPDSVTSIGERAFEECINVVSVNIPGGVTSIEERTFAHCRSLINVNVPDGVTSIGRNAFENCDSLISVDIPDGVTRIERYTFYNCTSLLSVNIPDDVVIIGENAFKECNSLMSIVLGNDLIVVYEYAFENCNNLTSITFEGPAPAFLNDCFLNVIATVYYPANDSTWTEEVKQNYGGTLTWMPKGTEEKEIASGTAGDLMWVLTENGTLTISGAGEIPDYSFGTMPWNDYAGQILKVVVEDGVTAIGDYAFRGLSEMTSISIPEGITRIGGYAFKGCSSLPDVTLPQTLKKLGESAFYGCSSLKSISIPEGIYTVWAYTFKNCTSLSEVTLPSTLIKIDEAAFYGCSSLACMEIPDSVSIIGIYCFKNCTGLTEVYLPSKLTEIREAAFYGTGLTHVEVPEGVTKIGPYAFKNAASIASISLPSTLTDIQEAAFYHSAVSELVIPDEVISIGSYAFKNCTTLQSVQFPSKLETIGESAFYGCESMTSLVIPEGATMLKGYAFKNCTGLTEVILPESLTNIGESAFYGCTGLAEMTIPRNVKTVGTYVFSRCSRLGNVEFMGDAPDIGENAFSKVIAKVYYPAGNSTWTPDVMQNYGGTLTWTAN